MERAMAMYNRAVFPCAGCFCPPFLNALTGISA